MMSFKHVFIVIEDKHQQLAALNRAVACLGKGLLSITIYRHTRLVDPKHHEKWSMWQKAETAAYNALLAEFDAHLSVKCIFTSKHFTPSEFDESLQQCGAELVVRLHNEQGFLNGIFVSGLDHYFMADCCVPVWFVKPRQWDQAIEVLACLDIDDDGEINHQLNSVILQSAESLAQQLNGQLHVIDCFWGDVGSMSFARDNSGRFRRLTNVQGQHQALIQRYIAEYALPEQSLHIVEGTPDFAIPDTASRLHAELVVIGNNADHGVMDRLFGDTAVNLVKNVECDILVIKP